MKRLLRALVWASFLVLLVASGLYIVPLARKGIATSARAQTTLSLLDQARDAITADAPSMQATLDRRMREARSLGAVALEARRNDVRARLGVERAQRRPELNRRAAWLSGTGLAQDLEREARIAVLEAELEYLDDLATRYERITRREALLRQAEAIGNF